MKLFFVGYRAKISNSYEEFVVQAESKEQLEGAIKEAFPNRVIGVFEIQPRTVESAINHLRNGVAS